LFVQDATRKYGGVLERVRAELVGLTGAFSARQES
jgi:hypothetical protein